MNTVCPVPLQNWASSLVQKSLLSAEKVRSNEINEVYRLTYEDRVVFLKRGPGLKGEYLKLQWLAKRQPSPEPLGFTTVLGADALLMSGIEGQDLAELTGTCSPQEIVRRLASALKALHATEVADWPFERGDGPAVLVHGDACLPNFIYQGDRLSGYLDIGDMRVDDPDVDLAATVWSLQYNLGPGYGLAFLREYGIDSANEADVERLRLMYAETDIDSGNPQITLTSAKTTW